MERIIAGRFPTLGQADAASALMAPYIDASDICIFHNNPPGQHDPLVADADPVDDDAGDGPASAAGGAVATALAAGAVGTLGGPLVAIVAAGVGAYAGSFVGALAGLGDGEAAAAGPDHRAGGVMLSVRISEPVNELRVIETLRAEGAEDIEHAQGEWADGDWIDFDPAASPKLVSPASF
jgi:hypothetical protein